jgi:hypothetical protein
MKLSVADGSSIGSTETTTKVTETSDGDDCRLGADKVGLFEAETICLHDKHSRRMMANMKLQRGGGSSAVGIFCQWLTGSLSSSSYDILPQLHYMDHGL